MQHRFRHPPPSTFALPPNPAPSPPRPLSERGSNEDTSGAVFDFPKRYLVHEQRGGEDPGSARHGSRHYATVATSWVLQDCTPYTHSSHSSTGVLDPPRVCTGSMCANLHHESCRRHLTQCNGLLFVFTFQKVPRRNRMGRTKVCAKVSARHGAAVTARIRCPATSLRPPDSVAAPLAFQLGRIGWCCC